MKKTLVSFTISFACFIGFCTFANAEIIQSWNITTKNVDAWKMAEILKGKDSEFAGTKAETVEAVLNNYVNGFSTVLNSDKTLSKGGSLNYGNVKSVGSGNYYGVNAYRLTSPNAHYDHYDSVANPPLGSWEAFLYSPGYYAFQTEFSLSSGISDLSDLYLNIDLDMLADNILEGIFLNGYEITQYSSLKGINGVRPIIGGLAKLELTGSVLLDDLIGQGLFLTDGANTLEFVIHNRGEKDNQLEFAALGAIDIGEQRYAQSFNPTPEPATLLICLTCGGLALAIRRRKNKKTE
jgi:hypothetical protein